MPNARPKSAGFIVVNVSTREILSDLCARREEPRKIAGDLFRQGVNAGVHQVMLYPGEKYDRSTYRP
jgi:hypothetical protein